MPDPAATEKIEKLLNERAGVLEAEIAAAQALERENERDRSPHEAVSQKDEANDNVLAEIGEAELERDRAELRAIARARERLADGSYGICEDCGVDIDARRLAVQPTAARCVACQEALERTQG